MKVLGNPRKQREIQTENIKLINKEQELNKHIQSCLQYENTYSSVSSIRTHTVLSVV